MTGILTKPAVLGCIALSLFRLPARADLIINGNFESPAVPGGSYTDYDPGSLDIPGWTIIGSDVAVVSGSFKRLGASFPAGAGAQWLDLSGGVSNTPGGVQQTVATVPGIKYNLSYLVGNVVAPSGPWGATSTVGVLINGILVQSAVNSDGNRSTQSWELFHTSFVAGSSATVLEFMDLDPRLDLDDGLDNVELTPAQAVPEPSFLGFLAVAACGLTLLSRRLRRFQVRSRGR